MNKMRSTIKISIFFLLIFTLTIPTVSAETDGFTLKAATISHPVSNNKDLEDANMTLLVGSGGGQSLYGKFGNEQFTQWIPNLLFKYPLVFELDSIKETADYQIRNQGDLKKLEYTIRGNWFYSAKCNPDIPYCFDVGSGKIIEVRYVDVGRYGSLDTPNLNFKGKATVTINGVPYTKEISNIISSIQFNSITGEFVALIKWDGSSVTGQGLPDQHNYVPVNKKDSGEWTLSTLSLYKEYDDSLLKTEIELNNKKEQKRKFDNKFYEYAAEKYVDKYSICKDNECSPIVNIVNEHNAKLTKLLDSREKIGYESSISSVQNSYKDGNVLVVLNRRINIPEFTIITTAKSVGAYIPVGEFQIIDITSPTFSSGDNNGKVDVKVRNIGNYRGTFSLTLIDETNTFKQISNSKSLETSLEPGKETIITMYISSGIISSDITKTAKIEVYDINNPNNLTSKDFTVSVTTPKICQPDSQRLDNKKVYTCSNDGMREYLTLDCSNGIIDYNNNTYDCTQIEYNKDLVITNAETPIKIVEVQNKTKPEEPKEETPSLIYWLVGFVILNIYIAYIRKYKNKDETITSENIQKSVILSGLIIGTLYLLIQFTYLIETLGSIIWLIFIMAVVIIGLINVYLKVIYHMNIPKIYIITASIILFIILSNIAIGIKETACDSWSTRWLASKLFDTCKEWTITDYLPEWLK